MVSVHFILLETAKQFCRVALIVHPYQDPHVLEFLASSLELGIVSIFFIVAILVGISLWFYLFIF